MKEASENVAYVRDYAGLKQRLVAGEASFSDIKDTLLAYDQVTATRDAADDNLSFLRDPEITACIEQQDASNQADYHRFLSFTEFHAGQRLAATDTAAALEHFKMAHQESLLDTENDGWSAYIEGTCLYLEGKQIPDEIIVRTSEPSTSILLNLNTGLRERGSVDYKADYMKR